ncbi:hypothetical protein CYLTODRAFT_173299 [Cylindrobasidium torrendii FP15055 ss-10]|uniref:Uncharacterized protein n=1 Tax=Cylindrobasidium torrendii FP15055 ss-10 TaxID=1314674 RepID=A0A0D7AZ28_9AGAR|nr:hypothetical protein CYLTODRAFT_173299 [Cylindrobasidium torrendii FP15055 ss-10]
MLLYFCRPTPPPTLPNSRVCQRRTPPPPSSSPRCCCHCRPAAVVVADLPLSSSLPSRCCLRFSACLSFRLPPAAALPTNRSCIHSPLRHHPTYELASMSSALQSTRLYTAYVNYRLTSILLINDFSH